MTLVFRAIPLLVSAASSTVRNGRENGIRTTSARRDAPRAAIERRAAAATVPAGSPAAPQGPPRRPARGGAPLRRGAGRGEPGPAGRVDPRRVRERIRRRAARPVLAVPPRPAVHRP